jgi:steroid 5-alpha reductase family enzyme
LDTLQLDAQKSELDHTNTSPPFFIFVALVQIPVIMALSFYATTKPDQAASLLPAELVSLIEGGPNNSAVLSGLVNLFSCQAAFNVAGHWIGFAIAVLIGTTMFFDITEDITYFCAIVWAFTTIQKNSPDGVASTRQFIAYACALTWCIRLCAFVGYRVIVRGSDWRFDKLALAHAYQFFGWTSGGTWCWANGFCLWYIAEADQTLVPWGHFLDWAGLAIFTFGLVFEFTADLQKYKFNSAHASGENKKWISSGLWSLSRHPNYFGETTAWFGLALICMSGSVTARSCITCLVSPAFSFTFLLFTSLMLLEKRGDSKWGSLRAYNQYKADTPVWMPKVFN